MDHRTVNVRFCIQPRQLVSKFGVEAESYWDEARAIALEDSAGFCHVEGDQFAMLSDAKPLVRIIAAKFDRWLGTNQFQYSKAV